ncbi:MAG: hypothetical protein GKR95_20185 [Gammaproteobacteria bacterium]|nr:hypothetical protein [Gammaproteobacteria bacterium]
MRENNPNPSDNNEACNPVLDEVRLAPYLDIEQDGYRGYVMPVNGETNQLAVHIRELHKNRLSNAGYQGYDNRIDDEYHKVGHYYFVIKGGTVVLTSRMNDRSQSRRFPFEMGVMDDGCQYVFNEGVPAVDINTYSLVPKHRKKGMPLLLASLGKYAHQMGAKKAFCLVDEANAVVQRIYHDAGFVYSRSYPKPIAFSTFTMKENNKPVRWKIMEWGFSTIQYYQALHEKISRKA